MYAPPSKRNSFCHSIASRLADGEVIIVRGHSAFGKDVCFGLDNCLSLSITLLQKALVKWLHQLKAANHALHLILISLFHCAAHIMMKMRNSRESIMLGSVCDLC